MFIAGALSAKRLLLEPTRNPLKVSNVLTRYLSEDGSTNQKGVEVGDPIRILYAQSKLLQEQQYSEPKI